MGNSFKDAFTLGESLYTASYVLGNKTSFDINNYMILGAQRFAESHLLTELQKAKVESVELKDKNGNAFVAFDKTQQKEVKYALDEASKDMKYLPVSESFLSQISHGRNSPVRQISNLPDFNYHLLVETLPSYKINFSATTIGNNRNEISFLQDDYPIIKNAISEISEFAKSETGKSMLFNYENAKHTLSEIERRIKNKESVYVAFKADNVTMNINSKKTEISINGKISELEGSPFENDIWDNIAMQVVSRTNSVSMSEKDFNSPNREQIIEKTLQEIKNNLPEIDFDVDETLDKVEVFDKNGFEDINRDEISIPKSKAEDLE